MISPLVRELAVDGIPVAVTCRVLKIARQPYYRWLAVPVTAEELAGAYRADALFDAHRDDPEFTTRSAILRRPPARAACWPGLGSQCRRGRTASRGTGIPMRVRRR
jgi:hypothetical protein